MRRAFVNLRGNSLPDDVTGRLLLLSRLVWPAERTTWEPDQRATTLENLDGSTLTCTTPIGSTSVASGTT